MTIGSNFDDGKVMVIKVPGRCNGKQQALMSYMINQIKGLPFRIVNVEEIVPKKVVRCTFSDGDVQKAVCCEEDTFTLEAGISVCITKHLLGGTANYNKAIKHGVDCYKNRIKAEAEAKRVEEQVKRRREKYEAYKKRRDAKRREQYINEQAEILAKAMSILKEE